MLATLAVICVGLLAQTKAEDYVDLTGGATCKASSLYDPVKYTCDNAIDKSYKGGPGNEWISNRELEGAWIELTFPSPVNVEVVELAMRCKIRCQSKRYVLLFSDGTSVQHVREKCEGTIDERDSCGDKNTYIETVQTGCVTTKTLRITAHDSCMTDNGSPNNGFREIVVLGRKSSCAPTFNADITSGATCTASSLYGTQYTCDNAIDKSYKGGPGNEWISKKELEGAWIELTFPSEVCVTSVELAMRCKIRCQSKRYVFAFSGGKTVEFGRECEGTVDQRDSCGNDYTYIETVRTGWVTTKTMRITAHDSCMTDNRDPNNGFREIVVRGSRAKCAPTFNLFNTDITSGATCKASSLYDPVKYTCDNAIDKSYKGGPGNEWISKKELEGAWIELTFPSEVCVTSVELAMRCKIRCQSKRYVFAFSRGKTVEFRRECEGTIDQRDSCGNDYTYIETVRTGFVTTKTMRITAHDSCMTDNRDPNNGFREIVVFGSRFKCELLALD